jgi:putative ABC transport system permease protein
VQRLVLWDAFKRAAPGLALGLGTAYLIAPLFGVLLSGTKARDPVVFGATCVGYLVVCFVATLVPARRAASLDPGEILRSD